MVIDSSRGAPLSWDDQRLLLDLIELNGCAAVAKEFKVTTTTLLKAAIGGKVTFSVGELLHIKLAGGR